MLRVLFEPALLFLSPFIAYVIFLLLKRRAPFSLAHWTPRSFSSLGFAGLVIAVVGMLILGVLAPRHSGAYVPAHIENGTLVPGRIE